MGRNLLSRVSASASRAALSLLTILVIASAQESEKSLLRYELDKEVTLQGTVSAILPNAGPGKLWGAHLLLNTIRGTIDASLGRRGLGRGCAIPVSIGQSVEIRGVMKTIRGEELFLTRTLNVGSTLYLIRDERGVPISPHVHEVAGKEGEPL